MIMMRMKTKMFKILMKIVNLRRNLQRKREDGKIKRNPRRSPKNKKTKE
jgi:hypothetical protein